MRPLMVATNDRQGLSSRVRGKPEVTHSAGDNETLDAITAGHLRDSSIRIDALQKLTHVGGKAWRGFVSPPLLRPN